MLDWLTAVSQSAHGEEKDASHLATLEAPETPAPLFAVRAFKSALFGTPSLANHPDTSNREELSNSQADDIPTTLRSFGDASAKTETFSSPAKGILLTPGTNKLQRKTVSFGASRILREKGLKGIVATDGDASLQNRSKSVPGIFSDHRALEGSKEPSLAVNHTGVDDDKDVTIDLQEPRSRSGQHWKRQFSHYHMKSDHEMRALLKYTQNTKSFASRRDAETVDLKAKLKAALARVVAMEAKVLNLASQLAQSGNTSMDTEDQADLVRQLAHQTNEVLHYKRKVEELEQASRGEANDVHERPSEAVSPQEAGSLRFPGALDSANSCLSSEVLCARLHADSLDKENAALKKTILRVKDEMKQYEIRHKSRREEWRRKADRSKAKLIDLTGQLESQEISHHRGLMELKAAHAQEVDDLRRQLEECRSEATRAISRAQKERPGPRMEWKAENTKESKTNNSSLEHPTQEYTHCQKELRPLHGRLSRPGTKDDKKIDKAQAISVARARQLEASSVDMRDRIELGAIHKEHLQNSSCSQPSCHNQVTTNDESYPTSPNAQRLRPAHDIDTRDSPKNSGSMFNTMSSRNALPPHRLAAAQMRVEMRLALKQQFDAAGKENVQLTRL